MSRPRIAEGIYLPQSNRTKPPKVEEPIRERHKHKWFPTSETEAFQTKQDKLKIKKAENKLDRLVKKFKAICVDYGVTDKELVGNCGRYARMYTEKEMKNYDLLANDLMIERAKSLRIQIKIIKDDCERARWHLNSGIKRKWVCKCGAVEWVKEK